jgi:hypothetical protein
MRCTRAQNVMFLVGIVTASCFSPLMAAQSKGKEAMRSKEAEALHTKAREAGSSGDYAEALILLTKAAALAPDWPYPVYDRAFTRLLMEDFDGALADYEKTLTLSPRGFFTAHVAVDTLRREQQGEFPRGFYLAYTTLEHIEESQRRDILGQLVEKVPSFAPAWLDSRSSEKRRWSGFDESSVVWQRSPMPTRTACSNSIRHSCCNSRGSQPLRRRSSKTSLVIRSQLPPSRRWRKCG